MLESMWSDYSIAVLRDTQPKFSAASIEYSSHGLGRKFRRVGFTNLGLHVEVHTHTCQYSTFPRQHGVTQARVRGSEVPTFLNIMTDQRTVRRVYVMHGNTRWKATNLSLSLEASRNCD